MITGIILASGFSERMGEDKLLLKIDGITFIEKVIKVCLDSALNEIILVYRKKRIMEIGEKYKIRTIYNLNAHLGQSESIKLGVIKANKSEAYMFIMGDQPFLNSQLINRMIFEYMQDTSHILIPCYKGRKGTPTIFSSICKKELLKIRGDKGGREIIRSNFFKTKVLNIDDERIGMDIDTFEDYIRIIQQ